MTTIESPAEIEAGSLIINTPWSETIWLPLYRKNEDGSQGSAIDWTNSTFTLELKGALRGLTATVVPSDLAGPVPTIVILATAEATKNLSAGTGKWLLRESLMDLML